MHKSGAEFPQGDDYERNDPEVQVMAEVHLEEPRQCEHAPRDQSVE